MLLALQKFLLNSEFINEYMMLGEEQLCYFLSLIL